MLFRGDFCIAGILRDQFLFQDRTLLRPLLLAIALTLLLFTLARYAGLVDQVVPPTYGATSLIGFLGGWLFGVGMVLAGGCVVSTLYKMASGNLSHGVAFVGIIVGSLVYAELYPYIEPAKQAGTLTTKSLLIQQAPVSTELLSWLVIIIAAFFALRWHRQGLLNITAAAQGYLQPWKVAIGLALLNLAAYLANSWPIGISTAYLKIGVWLEKWLYPSHAAQVSYLQQNTLMTRFGSVGPDLSLMTELPLMMGILVGAFATAIALKEFQIYGLPPVRQGLAAFGGGILMALGARLSNGCNIKFMLGGLALFSFEALLFVGGMLLGAWHGARLLPYVIFWRKDE